MAGGKESGEKEGQREGQMPMGRLEFKVQEAMGRTSQVVQWLRIRLAGLIPGRGTKPLGHKY